MPITISDTFTRANTATGTVGSTETGIVLAWQNPTNFSISSNGLLNANNVNSSPIWVVNNVSNATVSMSTGSVNGPGVAFWVKDASNYWCAYLYSNRYNSGSTCNTCTVTDCTCGGCNVNAVSCSKSSSSSLIQSFSGCGACSSGSCSTGNVGACNQANVGTMDSYTYASCGGGCVNRTSRSRGCSGSSCGTISSSTNCVTSCSAANTSLICGNNNCNYVSSSCGGACGSTGRSNRNCTVSCSCSGGNTNAANSCTVTSCNLCGSSPNYRREYFLQVDRISGGTRTNHYSNLYSDTTSSTISLDAIKVTTTLGSYQVFGYSDIAMTTQVISSVLTSSGQTDYLTAVGHGLVSSPLGSAAPNQGWTFDNFNLTFDPLVGDSVGIIQG